MNSIKDTVLDPVAAGIRNNYNFNFRKCMLEVLPEYKLNVKRPSQFVFPGLLRTVRCAFQRHTVTWKHKADPFFFGAEWRGCIETKAGSSSSCSALTSLSSVVKQNDLEQIGNNKVFNWSGSGPVHKWFIISPQTHKAFKSLDQLLLWIPFSQPVKLIIYTHD